MSAATYVELSSPSAAADLVVVAARAGSLTVGLAVADLDGTQAHVRSFFVEPSHWGRGLGSGLAAALEDAVRGRGAKRIEAMYEGTSPAAGAAARVAERRGFQPSQPSTLVCRASERMRSAPWMKRPLSRLYHIFPWGELSDAERAQLKAARYPAALTPFPDEPVELLNSLGLRRDGHVVGWMLTHRLGPELIRYTSLFVDPGERALGPGMALLAEAIRRQLDNGVPFGIFGIGEANEPMIRLVRRRMVPYLDAFQEVRYVAKDL